MNGSMGVYVAPSATAAACVFFLEDYYKLLVHSRNLRCECCDGGRELRADPTFTCRGCP